MVDNIFPTNHGPGVFFLDRSLTCENGFLCLEYNDVCAVNDRSSPPLIFVKLTRTEEDRIRRIFNFSGVLNSGDIVIGKRAVLILVQDLITDPYRIADCGHSL